MSREDDSPKCECGIVRNANVGYNFESAKHVECVIMMQYCGKEKK